ncbi:hypothetical protein BH10PSE15_BH10PSE15_00550 [soil metagenome]
MAMNAPFDKIDFGSLPAAVNRLLQQGVLAYRSDRSLVEMKFLQAVARDPAALPTYLCLYKIHTYQGNLVDGQAMAKAGLEEAARQCKWPQDWRDWPPLPQIPGGPGRFALHTLKALAFIALRDDRYADASEMLGTLRRLDPAGAVGWAVQRQG